MTLEDERHFGITSWVRFMGCNILMFFNPWTASQILIQGGGQFIAAIRVYGKPSDSVVRIQLPVRGRWRVYSGGLTRETSHSWSILAQRYAYDLVAADKGGRRFQLPGTQAEDFFAFGKPVYSPVSGRILNVRDDCRDFRRSGLGWTDWLTRDIRGNFISIESDSGVYILLAHLYRGSITVKQGERISLGQILGRVGNSGNSTEPHLHIHVQDRNGFSNAVGVPFFFEQMNIDSGSSWPKEGDFVKWDKDAGSLPDIEVPPISKVDVMLSFLICTTNLAVFIYLWQSVIKGLVGVIRWLM